MFVRVRNLFERILTRIGRARICADPCVPVCSHAYCRFRLRTDVYAYVQVSYVLLTYFNCGFRRVRMHTLAFTRVPHK